MIEIRKAAAADAATISKFQVLLARETEGLDLDPATVARGVSAVLADAAKGTYFVAEERGASPETDAGGGRFVGCLLITTEWSDWRNGTWWWIQSVYVMPEARRGGVFRLLYEHVKGLVSADPTLCGLRLYVDRSNTRAQKVYEAMGMSPGHYRVCEWEKDERRA